jgi:hypothetical protein
MPWTLPEAIEVAEHYQLVCARQFAEIEGLRSREKRLLGALVTIVRQNARRGPIGHDAMIAARRLVKRYAPEKFARIERVAAMERKR